MKAPSHVAGHWARWHLWIWLVLLISGCLTTTSGRTTLEEGYQPVPASKINPARSKKEGEPGKAQSARESPATTGTQKQSTPRHKIATRRRKMGPDAGLKKRLQSAATQLAKDLGSVRKMKLCHDQKADEWWLTLYRELSTAIDVKQYVWSWEREEFAPFLVVKRISKSRLMEDLRKNEPGRTCKELPAPQKNPDDPFEKFWGRSLDFESR